MSVRAAQMLAETLLEILQRICIFFQYRDLRFIVTAERLDAREVVLRPPGAARPIGPSQPDVTVLGQETQDMIERQLRHT